MEKNGLNLDLLKEIFDVLPEETMSDVLPSISLKRFKAGHRLITQGEQGDKFYIIQFGTCNVSVEKDQETYPIASLKSGDLVGEMAIITGEPRLANVDAETDVIALEIGIEQFDELCDKYPNLREFLTKVVEQRLYSSIFKEDREIGKYAIQEILGKGSTSIVYRGIHKDLNMSVAIKMLKHNMAMDLGFYNKFKEEAQIIVQLTHQNIIKVYDIVNLYRTIFIFMEHIAGESLDKILDKTPQLPLSNVINILLQICSGLAYSHECNLIHQDIKPTNIFVLADGKVKIIDFGLSFPRSSIDDSLVGILQNMSPEQVSDEPIDERTDIYSLGILAFEMITGQKPFVVDNYAKFLETHASQEIPGPGSLRADLPDKLNQLVIKATQKNPDKRYQNISEIISDLKALADKMDIPDLVQIGDIREKMTLSLNYRKEQTQDLKKMVQDFGQKLKEMGVDFRISEKPKN